MTIGQSRDSSGSNDRLSIIAFAKTKFSSDARPGYEISDSASRGISPQPRGKPSGLPFHARFTDVEAAAGLREPVICGAVGHTDYVLESMGCGIAFLDYDNDAWLDIFVLSGTRRDGPGRGRYCGVWRFAVTTNAATR